MTASDLDLLQQYARQHSERAFATLVERHLNLVYSAALRQMRSPQLAEEIAQSVFTDLARAANKLKPETILTAWLYQVTHRTAIDVVRREARRQLREQIATEMNTMNATAADWAHIEPLLDEAMDALEDTNRTAVLLRYFENKSLREVGQTLGTSDDTAQKRVSRAVERLREFFAKRGVTVGASGFVVVISANAVQAAPIGLAMTLSSAALATATAGNGTLSLYKIMTATKLKVGAISTVIVASAVTALVLQQQSQATLQEVDRAFQQQANQLAQRQVENQQLSKTTTRPSANKMEELHRLRGEVVTLREQANGLARLREEARQLRSSLDQTRSEPPSNNEQSTANSEELKACASYSMEMALAAFKYADKHGGHFPTNLVEAAAYFSAEARDETNLTPAQFEIVYTGSSTALAKFAHPGRILFIRQKHPWKNTDGRWVKSYSFADGSRMSISTTDGDFESWEKKRIAPPESPHP